MGEVRIAHGAPCGGIKADMQLPGVDFEPSMLDFYRAHEAIEEEMPEGRHHRLLSKPATTEHIGRYREAFERSQIALVEQLLGEEMQALDYAVSSGPSGTFGPREASAFEKAEVYYRQMLAGDIRRRLRRRGMLKLRAYQTFGSALDVVPSWRVATTDRHWQSLKEELGKPEAASPPREAPSG